MFRCNTVKTIEKLKDVTLGNYSSERLLQNIATFEKLNFIDMKVNPISQNKTKYVLAQV